MLTSLQTPAPTHTNTHRHSSHFSQKYSNFFWQHFRTQVSLLSLLGTSNLTTGTSNSTSRPIFSPKIHFAQILSQNFCNKPKRSNRHNREEGRGTTTLAFRTTTTTKAAYWGGVNPPKKLCNAMPSNI